MGTTTFDAKPSPHRTYIQVMVAQGDGWVWFLLLPPVITRQGLTFKTACFPFCLELAAAQVHSPRYRDTFLDRTFRSSQLVTKAVATWAPDGGPDSSVAHRLTILIAMFRSDRMIPVGDLRAIAQPSSDTGQIAVRPGDSQPAGMRGPRCR